MKTAIFTFSKPTASSMVAGNHIARFLSVALQTEIYWDDQINQKWDVLYIVGGAFAFCKHLAAIGGAVEKAKRIIWVQNDYTIIPPKPESQAESPFRAAFRNRRNRGLPDMDYWTTIKKNATATPRSHYINFNQLTYDPLQPAALPRDV